MLHGCHISSFSDNFLAVGFKYMLVRSIASYILAFIHVTEAVLFSPQVASLAQSESVSALSVITSAINGTRAFNDGTRAACATCGEERAPKKCSKCRQVQYCDRECQRLHWFIHKKECARLGATANSTNAPQDATEVVNQLTELKVN